MTDLTMEQRRQDFESMLERANRIVRAGRFAPPAPPEPPERLLTTLASDVTNLAAVWAECVQTVRDGEHPTRVSTRAAMKALTVAARCLQALSECEAAPDYPDVLDWIKSRAKFWFEVREEEWLDMGVAPCDRVQSLLGGLSRVAVFWPEAPCVINQLGEDEGTHVQFDTLVRLAFEAICAALAAERGLWQEEES